MVGLGYQAGAQLTPEVEGVLRDARCVLYLTSDPVMNVRMHKLNPRSRSLHDCYREGVHGALAADRMLEQIAAAVREFKSVCVALDGHPAVYTSIAFEAMRRARAGGHRAHMMPAVSAVDCLYAALGLDPGAFGCQLFEATDFVVRRRRVDVHTPLILLQVGVVGVVSYHSGRDADRRGLRALRDRLSELYPVDHEIVLYEMPALPLFEPRIERFALRDLADVASSVSATLYVPATARPKFDEGRMARLGLKIHDGKAVRR